MHILYVCAYQPNFDSLSQDDYSLRVFLSTFTAIKKQQATKKKKKLIAKTKKKKKKKMKISR